MSSNAEEIVTNLKALLKIHSKAIDVINAAKKKDNKEISNRVGIHITLISRILSKAKDFEFVEKKGGKWIKSKKIKGYDLKRMVKPDNLPRFNELKIRTYNRTKEIKKNYESEFISEAKCNLKSYTDIYVIENTLRKIIFEAFGGKKDWWEMDFVSKEVFSYAESIRIAESKHPWIKKRGDHPIYYVGLEELKKIITKHWDKYFKWIGNRDKFMVWVDEIIPIRNMIAHNVRLEAEEINTVETKSKWLITLINNQKNEPKNKIQTN
ncbi:MAG: hypothetical protein AABX70_05865 [Nanoarchaeota archaeon]